MYQPENIENEELYPVIEVAAPVKKRGRVWEYCYTKILTPILNQFRQGVSAEKLALAFSIGAVIGFFPIIGTTTFLCTVFSVKLKLNLPVVQLANHLVFVPFLLIFIPMLNLGAYIFQQPELKNASQIVEMFKDSPWHALRFFLFDVLRAIAVWAAIAPVLGIGLYFSLKYIFGKMARKKSSL